MDADDDRNVCILTDCARAICAAHARFVEAASTNLPNKGGSQGISPGKSFLQRWDASCGELAGSLISGLTWRMGVNEFGKPDAGRADFKTRPDKVSGDGKPYGCRYVPGRSNPRWFYATMISVVPLREYRFVGGMWGWEIEQHPDYDSWIKDPGGKGRVCWVPREVLYFPDWATVA